MRLLSRSIVLLALLMLVVAPFGVLAQTAPVTIDFYFPEASANNAQAIFEEYAAQFSELHPEITVNVAYQGSYTDNRTKIQTELAAGAGPDVAVMLTTDLFSFVEDGTIVAAQPFIDAMEDGEAFTEDFFPAFLLNSVDEDGMIWSVPFQRSTPILYYNADLFAEAGIEAAPRSREELVEVAKQLTTDDRFGLWLPTEGFPIWLFSSFLIGGGQPLVEASPTDVFFNDEVSVEAVNYILSLSQEHKVMPEGLLSWGDAPTIFTSGQAAMIFHTTGSLTRILSEATFEVGTAFMPTGSADADGNGYGAPTGGGNLYLFANSTPEEQAAAWLWIEFLASPEIQADWTARTGYIAARQSAWETDTLTTLVEAQPQYAIARDQLEFAQKEFSAFRTIDLQNIINPALSNLIAGTETDVQATLDAAQAQIDSLLAEYR
ncbi:MAG: ABC transporter substrate-binding protein [Armatimonadetes bacterium]|nr:ABC transporter substrate-binding protein [Anaerolineae bacterium]